MSDDLPVLEFETAAAFRAWLEAEHARAPGVWIKMARRASGIPSITPSEAIDVALCFGWIDGLRRGLDGTHFLQRLTPRRARSKWSQINVERVAALTEAGLMHPAGLAEVERAKADGRWEAAYPSPSRMTVPDDFREALEALGAREAFEALDSANRYAMLFHIHDAKRPETRERRIRRFAEMVARGERLHP